jgi:sterol desaturase/sphingolipid hydroxylase (fatty acid hydroxylase superfamily)
MTNLIIPIIFMLAVVLGEALVLRYLCQQDVNWRDLVFNLNSGHIMLWLFRGVEIYCYASVAQYANLQLVSHWPATLLWLFALLAWDFGFYWLHRLHHQLPGLWAIHVVHHQGEHYNLSLGVRNSWYSSLTSIPFFMLLAVAGVPLSVFISVSLLHYTVQLFNHNALTPKLGMLEWIFVTPSHHRVHHVNDRAYSERNYGGSFIFWDKLFGTFCPALPKDTFRYGAGKAQLSANPFWASNQPFFDYFKWPLHYRSSPPGFQCSNLCLTSAALLLFSQVIGYVYQFGYGYQHITTMQVVLFLLLACGTLALGGISEGRRWGKTLWLLITLALPILFLGVWHWYHGLWWLLMPLTTLHALLFTLGWGNVAEGREPNHAQQ